MNVPRILFCAGASGSGKTLITCGILQALMDLGLKPASFKCGPDYIDPMFHTKVIGTKSRNLDTFFTEDKTACHLLWENSRESDLAVIEGVMGYYDGLGGVSVKASAYDVSRATKTPSVLIVNGKGMSLSVCAHIKGFVEFRPDSNIQGVILNEISPMIYDRLKVQIEAESPVKVIGYVPKVEDCRLDSRHLGLVMPEEVPDLKKKVEKLASIMKSTLDLDLLLKIAKKAPSLAQTELKGDGFMFRLSRSVKIAVARDPAFCFFYEDNLQLLKKMGAEPVFFSPIDDEALPEEVDGLILPGGYPELFADKLAENLSMRASIKKAVEKGLPLLAECGGFIYLHQTMEDEKGAVHEGVGIIQGHAYRTDKLGRFGYINLKVKEQERENFFSILERDPGTLPGHEFHYFDSTDCGKAFTAEKPSGGRHWDCIHCTDTVMAGFPHFYYYGNPALPEAFLRRCEKYRERKEG